MHVQRLTLKQLRYLIALDDAGHFRRAAELCGISQPSLSAQIQNLEDVLGVQIADRGRTKNTLTPIGREVSKRAKRAIEEVQCIIDFCAGAQRGLVGTIRLGTKATLGPYILPQVVANLHMHHPDLNLYIREAAPQDLVRELVTGRHDVILAQLPVAGADLITERLFREPLYLALAVDHPLARQDEITGEELKGQQILSLSPTYRLHGQIAQICSEYGATLSRDYEGTSLDALRQMVGMGMGVTFLPALYVVSEIPVGSEVVVKPFANNMMTRSVGLVWRKSAGRANAFHELATIIRNVATERFPTLSVEN